jgi:molybdenum cofactor cytidylyltransferase
LADVGGKAMVRWAVEAALASGARPVLVVTGHQGADVRAVLAELEVTFVDNPDYAAGLSTSLKAGIRAVPALADGALVVLGDMPLITSAHLDRLIAAFAECKGSTIIVSAHAGKRGNPVLWPRTRFGEMLQLDGDTGARRLMAARAAEILEVDLGTDAIFTDVDTPEALAGLKSRA